jgi:hypothetical protein
VVSSKNRRHMAGLAFICAYVARLCVWELELILRPSSLSHCRIHVLRCSFSEYIKNLDFVRGHVEIEKRLEKKKQEIKVNRFRSEGNRFQTEVVSGDWQKSQMNENCSKTGKEEEFRKSFAGGLTGTNILKKRFLIASSLP